MDKVALVYHYFAHYRAPVLRQLKTMLGAPNLVLISDSESNMPALKLMPLENSVEFKWMKVRNWWLPMGWLWQRGLLASVIKADCDSYIFLGQFNFASTWFAAALVRLRGKRAYFWTHGIYGNEGVIKRWIRLLFYRLGDVLLVYGNRSRDLLLRAGFNKNDVYVIYNSVGEEVECNHITHESAYLMNEVRQSLLLKFADCAIVIFCGRLARGKDLQLLVDALAVLRARMVVAKLLIVGDGPERRTLEAYAQLKLGAESVLFVGECYSEKLLSVYFGCATVCVSPGNVGLTAVHAMMYGVPVISHDDMSRQMPEAEAIVEGATGRRFIRGNVPSLADAILAVVTQDGSELYKMREKCRRMVREYYNPRRQAELIGMALSRLPASRIDFKYRIC